MVFICLPAAFAARRTAVINKVVDDSQVISDVEMDKEGCTETKAEYKKHTDEAARLLPAAASYKTHSDAAAKLLPDVTRCHGGKLKMGTKLAGGLAIMQAKQAKLEAEMQKPANQGLIPKIRQSATELYEESQLMLSAHTELKMLCLDPEEGSLRTMITSGKIATLSRATHKYKDLINEVADALEDVRAQAFMSHVDKMIDALVAVTEEWNFVAPTMVAHAITQEECIPTRLFFNNTDWRTQVRKQFVDMTAKFAKIHSGMTQSLETERGNVAALAALSQSGD